MMPTLIRWFAVISSLLTLWAITAGLAIHGVVLGLYGLELAWGWFYPDLERGLSGLGVDTGWLPGGGYVPEPSWAWTLKWTAGVAAVLTAWPLITYWVLPIRHQVGRALGRRAWRGTRKVRRDEDLGELFAEVRRRVGVGSPVKLFLVAGPLPLAFAMSAPFRGAVVISEGLVTSLTRGELEWVMAHELAHIRHRDMSPSVAWLSSMRGIAQFEAVKVAMVNGLVRLLAMLRVPRVLLSALVRVIQVVIWTLHAGRWVAIRIFLLVDRWVSRRMEYRADAVAASAYGAEPGVRALSKLGGDAEPLFNGLFATHPRISSRIRRLVSQ